MFKITEHVEFNASGRAVCPSCAQDGKSTKLNLSLIPDTDGAYKCFRGCSPEMIRSALGASKPQQIPQALATPVRVTTVSPSQVKTANQQLLDSAGPAKQWLHDRLITDEMISRYQLGKARSAAGNRHLPAISIPIPANADGTAYYQKKRVAPWDATASELPGYMAWSQKGLPALVWFSYLPAEASQTWLCEGEWDAMLLGWHVRQADLPVAVASFTCGCKNVPPADQLELLPGDVTIFYDRNDKPLKDGSRPGDDGALKAAKALGDRAKLGKVPMFLDSEAQGWDVTDAFKAGYTLTHFVAAAAAATAPPAPPEVKKHNPLRERLVWNDELMARAPDYTEWLVDELLTANELFLLAAGPRAGKSLMAMTLAKAVAEGGEFLGRPVTQGTVIYVCMEDGENKLKARETAQGWSEGLPVVWLQKFKLSELPYLRELVEELDPRLVIIDTLSRVKDSGVSESSAEMSQLLDPIQEMAKDLECCCLLVHHTGKVNLDTADQIDVFDTIRGSSAIRAVCRGTMVLAAGERNYRLCVENGWGKHDLNIILDANTLTWRLIGEWKPTINGDQKSRVIQYLKQTQEASLEQMHADLDIPRDSLYKVLSKLATAEVAEEKVVKKGRRRCYVYTLELFHKAESLLDYIGQNPIQSNRPNPDTASDRCPIGQNLLFSSDASGSIIDQSVTCASLIDDRSDSLREVVQYKLKRGSNPGRAKVLPIGQLLDSTFSEVPQSQTEQASQPIGSLLDSIGQRDKSESRIDQSGTCASWENLKQGDWVEFLHKGKWFLAEFVRQHPNMKYSRHSRSLEAAIVVQLADESTATITFDRLRRPVEGE
ncbi:MAG: AAA family ATPase [Pegethrix bostrychoides GSE-TBD4-15B]|jgi:hypothetical protein|uniref:AAA family ATPase n=1 Tax=Pegethrix bostrychoides GSE-TBD4-15B TaxID=2839662 RepID=A0A951PG62_9CYAN|nr:AAA family ATPase [Pegethrix bostrychoides GSE-TBD4-15B]